MDSVQRRPRERHADLVAEKPVQRSRAQRPQPHSTDFEISPSETEWRHTLARDALGHQEAGRFIDQPARHELEHERRGRIQPLHVVHRQEDAPICGQPLDDAKTRRRDRPLIRWRPLLLREQERRFERTPLDRGDRSERFAQYRLEQVGQPRKRQPSLALCRTRDEDANIALSRLFQPDAPHGCLSDTRLTRKHERRWELAVEKGADGSEFLVSPDDRGERGGHDKVDYATNRRGDLIRSPEASVVE